MESALTAERSVPPKRNFFAEVWRYRFAMQNLMLKDFRVRYRNMSLGIVWSVINPLVMLGVLVFVFSYIHPNRQQQYFPIFLLLGLIPFNFFSLCMSSATGSICDNASLVKKVIFPRQIVPISVVLSQVIHLLIQLSLLVFFILLFRVPLTWTYLWIIPIYMAELLFILGLSLITSAINVYYRDMQYLMASSLAVLFWFTPIFYSLKLVKLNLHPALYALYICNPLAGFVDASRQAVLYHSAPSWESFGVSLIVTAVVCVVGLMIFRRKSKDFADKI